MRERLIPWLPGREAPKGAFLFTFIRMKDNFSRQSEKYARYRPEYPEALFDFIVAQVPERNAAWDCATGNGQTAYALARYFKKVFATDISQAQLDKAKTARNIIYSCQPAEKTSFENNSFDLVTVSQALHWLHFDIFYAEVIRTVKPGGWIAAWMYSLPVISPEIDEWVSQHFYKETIGPYWDYERRYVDEAYRSIPFPFAEIPCPVFTIKFEWKPEQLEGYLNTWSALQKFIQVKGYNPVDELMNRLRPLWKGERMQAVFPVTMRMGRILK